MHLMFSYFFRTLALFGPYRPSALEVFDGVIDVPGVIQQAGYCPFLSPHPFRGTNYTKIASIASV